MTHFHFLFQGHYGTVRIKRNVDREQKNIYNLEITAADGGVPLSKKVTGTSQKRKTTNKRAKKPANILRRAKPFPEKAGLDLIVAYTPDAQAGPNHSSSKVRNVSSSIRAYVVFRK